MIHDSMEVVLWLLCVCKLTQDTNTLLRWKEEDLHATCDISGIYPFLSSEHLQCALKAISGLVCPTKQVTVCTIIHSLALHISGSILRVNIFECESQNGYSVQLSMVYAVAHKKCGE